jgi:hypothetical protein
LPVPFAPDTITIHEVLLVAVQSHPLVAVTDTLLVPPAAVKLFPVGDIENEQGLLPDCVTVKVCPAIVAVPVRGVGSGLGCTLNPTSPLPLPDKPDVIVTKGEFDVAVQPQPDGALTATLLLPPVEPNVREVGEIVNTHPLPVPACVTVNVRPATVIVPLLDVAPVLADTE